MIIKKATVATLHRLMLAVAILAASWGGNINAQTAPQNQSQFSTLLQDIGTALGSLRAWLGGNSAPPTVWIGKIRPINVRSDNMQFTSSKLPFDTVDDTGGFISPWTAPGTLSIPQSGYYTLSINIGFNESSTRGGRGVRLWKGSQILGTATSPAVPNISLSLTATHFLQAGDTITAYVSQTSGETVSLLDSSSGAGFFSITKI